MTRIEAQLLKSQKRIAAMKATARKIKERKAKKIKKAARPSGRPRINPALIAKARELAKTKPIADVAFQLGIATKTLSNYGITRAALTMETTFKRLSEAKNKT